MGDYTAVSVTDSTEHPPMFICCITSELMSDPVVTADGYSYERNAIVRWLRDHNTSPQTNLPLAHKQLVPNIALRQQIADYRASKGLTPPKPYIPPRDVPNRDVDPADPCPSLPGWLVAAVFLSVWLLAWGAGEVTVAKEVVDAFRMHDYSFATFFTLVWLCAWSFGGCVACSAMYGLCCRECLPALAATLNRRDNEFNTVEIMMANPPQAQTIERPQPAQDDTPLSARQSASVPDYNSFA